VISEILSATAHESLVYFPPRAAKWHVIGR